MLCPVATQLYQLQTVFGVAALPSTNSHFTLGATMENRAWQHNIYHSVELEKRQLCTSVAYHAPEASSLSRKRLT